MEKKVGYVGSLRTAYFDENYMLFHTLNTLTVI